MKKCVSHAKPMHSFQGNNHATISDRISRSQKPNILKTTGGTPPVCSAQSIGHERYNYRPLLSCFSCEMSFNSSDIAQPSSPFALLEPHSPFMDKTLKHDARQLQLLFHENQTRDSLLQYQNNQPCYKTH